MIDKAKIRMGAKLKRRMCLDEREIGDGLKWLVDRGHVNQGMAKHTARAQAAACKELPEIKPDWNWAKDRRKATSRATSRTCSILETNRAVEQLGVKSSRFGNTGLGPPVDGRSRAFSSYPHERSARHCHLANWDWLALAGAGQRAVAALGQEASGYTLK